MKPEQTAAKENRYIETCYGLVSDCPLMQKDGNRVRVPRCDVAFYLSEGWTRVTNEVSS